MAILAIELPNTQVNDVMMKAPRANELNSKPGASRTLEGVGLGTVGLRGTRAVDQGRDHPRWPSAAAESDRWHALLESLLCPQCVLSVCENPRCHVCRWL